MNEGLENPNPLEFAQQGPQNQGLELKEIEAEIPAELPNEQFLISDEENQNLNAEYITNQDL